MDQLIGWSGIVLLWYYAFLLGLFWVAVNSVRNRTLTLPNLPGKKRDEQWQFWMGIPFFAFILSWLSGASVTALFDDSYKAGILVSLWISAGALWILIGAGLFIGMRDRSANYRLSKLKDPVLFLTELRHLKVDGVLSREDLTDAQAQRSQLKYTTEPAWQRSIREELSEGRRLDSSCAPNLRGGWRDRGGKKIKVTPALIWRRRRHRWTSALHMGLPLILTLVAIPWLDGFNSFAVLGILALALLTAIAAYRAKRLFVIYVTRRNLLELEHKIEIDQIISDSKKAHKASVEAAAAATTRTPGGVPRTPLNPSRRASLFQELLEVLLRRLL